MKNIRHKLVWGPPLLAILFVCLFFISESESQEVNGNPPALQIAEPSVDTVPTENFQKQVALKPETARGPVDPLVGFLDRFKTHFPFGRDRQKALRMLIVKAPIEDVKRLLDMTFGDEPLNDISHVLIERLAKVDPDAALDFARSHAFGTDPPWWHSVIGGLESPNIALDDVHALSRCENRNSFIGHIAIRWAQIDKAAALDYAVNKSPLETRENAVANVVIGVSRTDHEEGMVLSAEYADYCGDHSLARAIAIDWATSNEYEQAREYVENIPEGIHRQEALYGLAMVTISRDLSNAWPLIEQITLPQRKTKLILAAVEQGYLSVSKTAGEYFTLVQRDLKSSLKSVCQKLVTEN